MNNGRNNSVKLLVELLVVAILVIGIFSMFALKTNATENKHAGEAKCYTSIEIKNGDTLWSIAKNNKPKDVSTSDYLKELKSMNGIPEATDSIIAGTYLTIYYYR